MTHRLIAFSLCVAMGTATAAAQPAPAKSGTRTLFISPCGEPFRAVAGERNPVLAWFSKADLNADGALDRAEFRADAAAFFKVLDQNGDGKIAGAEIGRYERVIAPEVISGFAVGAIDPPVRLMLAQFAEVDLATQVDNGFGGRLAAPIPKGYRGSLEGAAPYGLLADAEPVTMADLDVDGRISLDEFIKTSDRRFARLDKDGDGKIRLQDLPPTLEEQRMRGRNRSPS